jgi:hypothetical protein
VAFVQVGSNLTRAQTVSLLHDTIERRKELHRPTPSPAPYDIPPPQNPDDVYETMNYALSVLEKKMRGTASDKEKWQVEQLLRHAVAMQNRLHGPVSDVTRV